jgi:hypothetical protein
LSRLKFPTSPETARGIDILAEHASHEISLYQRLRVRRDSLRMLGWTDHDVQVPLP